MKGHVRHAILFRTEGVPSEWSLVKGTLYGTVQKRQEPHLTIAIQVSAQQSNRGISADVERTHPSANPVAARTTMHAASTA